MISKCFIRFSIKACIVVHIRSTSSILTNVLTWADPEGDTGARTPLKNHKNIVFRSKTGLDPLEYHKATKPAFNVGP